MVALTADNHYSYLADNHYSYLMTRIFYDTEFHENGTTIDLISIGMVRVNDDGTSEEYYAVSAEFDIDAVLDHAWLKANVWPYLPTESSKGKLYRGEEKYYPEWLDFSHPDVKPRSVIAAEVKQFVLADGNNPELWAYFGAYDHVALCQLYGTMMDLPDGFPMFTNDIRQVMRALNVDRDELPDQEINNHKAIDDARWNAAAYKELTFRTNDWGMQDI